MLPDFSSANLQVSVSGGEICWSLFNKMNEKDQLLQTNLRSNPKLTSSVLHPGNFKQSLAT